LSIRISLSGSTVDGNPFQKCFAFPPSMETPFKNVLSFHRRWKPFSKMFCLSTVDGNPFQKCFAFPPSMETPFKNVLPFHHRWKSFSKMFCLSAGDSSGCNSNCRIEDKIDFARKGLKGLGAGAFAATII
jgi:hypothetical protein